MKETEKPIIEVFKDCVRLMWTADPKCVPSPGIVDILKRAGYRVKVRKEEKSNGTTYCTGDL